VHNSRRDLRCEEFPPIWIAIQGTPNHSKVPLRWMGSETSQHQRQPEFTFHLSLVVVIEFSPLSMGESLPSRRTLRRSSKLSLCLESSKDVVNINYSLKTTLGLPNSSRKCITTSG
jgi:hypothetical protein